jgi:hypothetical protein
VLQQQSGFCFIEASVNIPCARAKSRNAIPRKLPPTAGLRPQKMSENEATTAQGPPHSTAPGRYPISLQLRYKANSKLGPVHGSGQTRMMSSKDIIFAPGAGLEPGMNAEIVLDWPCLRDDWIHLELVLKVSITSNQDGVIEARIVVFAFRTRPSGEPPEQIASQS